jgi:phosphomannomutase
LLEILSRYANPGQVLSELPRSESTPEINVPCAEGEPARVTAQLLQMVREQGLPGLAHLPQLSDIDGVRIDWQDGFGLIRASNTTPVLVLRFEGQTRTALQRIEADMMALLRAVKPDAQVKEAAH